MVIFFSSLLSLSLSLSLWWNRFGSRHARTAIKRIKLQEKRGHVTSRNKRSHPLSSLCRKPGSHCVPGPFPSHRRVLNVTQPAISRISILAGPGLLSILRCSINFRIDATRLRPGTTLHIHGKIFIRRCARRLPPAATKNLPVRFAANGSWNLDTSISLRIDIVR